MRDEGLSGRIAVVTGGSRGIGGAIAASLAAAGARVAVLDLRTAEGDPPTGRIVLSCDVSDEGSVETAFRQVEAELGAPDILVNAAGLAIRSAALAMTGADFAAVLGVNLTGAFLCSREAARRMEGRGGSIVGVASVMGFSGGLFPNAAYQASKGGLVNLTRALAVEWAPLGIRVNAVAPTYVETDLTRALLARPEALARVLDATPMRRLATVEEVADAVLFLAGARSGMTTGHTLPVDGGFLAV